MRSLSPVPARVLLALLATLALALASCGSDEESEPLQTSANSATEPARVAVASEAAKSPAMICAGLSRKKSSKVGKSAFSLCTSSVAKARKAKSATKACKGLSAKKDKTLRTSPKSICKKAAKEALKAGKGTKKKKDAGGDEIAVEDGDGTVEDDPEVEGSEDAEADDPSDEDASVPDEPEDEPEP